MAVQVATAEKVFAGPGMQVNGLEAVPEGLWLCDQRDNHAYLVGYDGRVLTRFPSPARNASGITFGAGSVWIGSNTPPWLIFRHDPTTGQCLAYLSLGGEGGVHGLQWRAYAADETPPAAAARRAELHPTAPAGHANAGPGASGTLWVSRPSGHRIEHLDAETGEVLGMIPFAPDRSHGMFWNPTNASLSVAETNFGHIYRFEPHSGELLEEWQVEGPEVHGLTRSQDGRIWIGDAASNEVLVTRFL
jgi:streptogramin lyase